MGFILLSSHGCRGLAHIGLAGSQRQELSWLKANTTGKKMMSLQTNQLPYPVTVWLYWCQCWYQGRDTEGMAAAPDYVKLTFSRVVSQLGRLLERHLYFGRLLPSLSIQCAVCCQRGALLSKATGMLIIKWLGASSLAPRGQVAWLNSPHPSCLLGNGPCIVHSPQTGLDCSLETKSCQGVL